MSYLPEAPLGPEFAPFVALQENFGFVPNLFRAQSLLPRVIEAQAALASTILFKEMALSRVAKERILLAIAAAHRNRYCIASHHQMIQVLGGSPNGSDEDQALLAFSVKLGKHGPFFSKPDVEALQSTLADDALLETILTASWASFSCTMSAGLGPAAEFPSPEVEPITLDRNTFAVPDGSLGPYLPSKDHDPAALPPFAFFRDEFGFFPHVFRTQTLRLDVLEAEVAALRAILLTQDHLKRIQKERILLVVSAANLNAYFVTVHCEISATLGLSRQESEQLVADHHHAGLAASEQALLDFTHKLATEPSAFGQEDIEALRSHGFSDPQILEAVAMTALTNFLNTVQIGLGARPDFAPSPAFLADLTKRLHLLIQDSRHTHVTPFADPDAEVVARVQGGEVDAFEELINRHSKRVYRTLVGILGNTDDARDAMQDTFLKTFRHLATFRGNSKFSTWLVSIASNTGLQRLRERKPLDSLDEESEEGFRPRQVRAWIDDPEQLHSKNEIRTLVESSVMRLPEKYRTVLILRDIEQLSTEETAEALGLGIPAMKARLLRGRLMLREALAPHFSGSSFGVGHD